MKSVGYIFRLLRCAFLGLSLVLAFAGNAAAVQVHGPPEGLYVHQMAHTAFAAAMVFLFYMLYRHPLGTCEGWKYLKLSIFFFLLWNIDTLLVHALGSMLPSDAVQGTSLWDQRLVGPLDWKKVLFYITRNDHFLCVPAMAFMVLFLRTFYLEQLNACKERKDSQDGSSDKKVREIY
jgi:hypothetical protein